MGIFKLNGVDYMGGGGGGDNSMELTYAEYLALPEEEKNNGTTYYVKDINGAGEDQFQPIIYSDEEREVGVWTDGKPLYQRTIRQAFTNRAKITIDTGIDYVQTIETTYYATGVYDSPMFITGATVYCYVQREQDNTITINNEYNGTIEWIVTIQYTKLSDTAGSGTWTPQGVPAVHYSETEHVIGTWVDGQTIYEITYELDTAFVISAQAWGTTTINVSFVSKFIEPAYVGTSGASSYICFVDISNNKLQLYNMRNDAAIGVKYVTIRYLKTQAN